MPNVVRSFLKAPLTAVRSVTTRKSAKAKAKTRAGTFAGPSRTRPRVADAEKPAALLRPREEPSDAVAPASTSTMPRAPSPVRVTASRSREYNRIEQESENSHAEEDGARWKTSERARSPLRSCNDTLRALSPVRASSPSAKRSPPKPQHDKYARMESSESPAGPAASGSPVASTALTAAPSATAATVNPVARVPRFPPVDFGFGTLKLERLTGLPVPRMTLSWRKDKIDTAGVRQMLAAIDAVLDTGERLFVLFDARSCTLPSAAHRKLVTLWSREKWDLLEERVHAFAVLLTSMMIRSTVNMMLSVGKPTQPHGVFAKEADALAFARTKCGSASGGAVAAPRSPPRAHDETQSIVGTRRPSAASSSKPTTSTKSAKPTAKSPARHPSSPAVPAAPAAALSADGEYLPPRLIVEAPSTPPADPQAASELDAADGWPLSPPLPRHDIGANPLDDDVLVLEDIQMGHLEPPAPARTYSAGGCGGCGCSPWLSRMRRWRCGRGGGALEELEDEDL